jgi:hypothetical protein
MKSYQRALGLCYKCSAKWSKDHQCAPEVLHAVEAFWEFCTDEEEPEEESDTTKVTEQVCLATSKAAVSSSPAARTVHLVGYIVDIPMQILVDSGSS